MFIHITQIKKQLNYRKTHRTFETLPLGSAIKFRRKELGMTLQEAAEDLTSVSYLSKLENNLIKPNMKYVKLYEKRLDASFGEHVYDSSYHDQIKQCLLALFLEQPLSASIFQQHESKQNHQSYLILLSYFVTLGEIDQIKLYDEYLKNYISNLTDDEMLLYLACVTQILMIEERYVEAYDLIKLYPNIGEEQALSESIQSKYKLTCAFHLMRTSEIENTYEKHISNLQNMHAFHLLSKTHIEYLIYQTYYLNADDIKQKLKQIPSMSEIDKLYIQALSYYHNGDYEKSKSLCQSMNHDEERWLILYVLNLDHLVKTEELQAILEDKKAFCFKKRSSELIIKHLIYKYHKNSNHLFSYLRELLSNRYLLTDDYQTLAYLYKDVSTLFSLHFFYKEAHQALHQWLIEHQLLTKSYR